MNALDELIQTLSRLPGLGKKSARRISFHLLQANPAIAKKLAGQIIDLKEKIHFCTRCGNFTEHELCPVCLEVGRDQGTICVVEQAQDISVIESAHEYRGQYHVLHGVLAPLDGVGPEKLNLAQLVHRVRQGGIGEIILATNPTLEGDTTALYIKQLFRDLDISITRLALGLPVGGDLEYADRLTLARSMKARTRL